MKGHGTLTFPDLSRYEGDVYNGYREGFGSMCVIGSQIYSGQWKCGKKHGWGWMLYKPGDWYEGEWDMCYKQGYGLRRYSSGDKYLGKWKEGNRHGMGSMLWYNCDVSWVLGRFLLVNESFFRCTRANGIVERSKVLGSIFGRCFSISR